MTWARLAYLPMPTAPLYQMHWPDLVSESKSQKRWGLISWVRVTDGVFMDDVIESLAIGQISRRRVLSKKIQKSYVKF